MISHIALFLIGVYVGICIMSALQIGRTPTLTDEVDDGPR